MDFGGARRACDLEPLQRVSSSNPEPCRNHGELVREGKGRELDYVHAANLADGTAQMSMSIGTQSQTKQCRSQQGPARRRQQNIGQPQQGASRTKLNKARTQYGRTAHRQGAATNANQLAASMQEHPSPKRRWPSMNEKIVKKQRHLSSPEYPEQ